MTARAGIDAKAYVNNGSPTPLLLTGANQVAWTGDGDTVELNLVQDLTLNLERNEIDVSSRSNNGWREFIGGLKNGGVDTSIRWDPGNAIFDFLFTSWQDATELGYFFADGAIGVTGTVGLLSNMKILTFTRNEPLEGALTADITLRPSSFTELYTIPA